jgi:hypothetical protein
MGDDFGQIRKIDFGKFSQIPKNVTSKMASELKKEPV